MTIGSPSDSSESSEEIYDRVAFISSQEEPDRPSLDLPVEDEPVFDSLNIVARDCVAHFSHVQRRRLRTLLDLYYVFDYVDQQIVSIRDFDPLILGQMQVNVELRQIRNSNKFYRFASRLPKTLQPQFIHKEYEFEFS